MARLEMICGLCLNMEIDLWNVDWKQLEFKIIHMVIAAMEKNISSSTDKGGSTSFKLM